MQAVVFGLRSGGEVDTREGDLDSLWDWFNSLGEGYRCLVYDGVGPDTPVVAEWVADVR